MLKTPPTLAQTSTAFFLNLKLNRIRNQYLLAFTSSPKNMEINITALLEKDLSPFSRSVHEGGEDACRNTWKNAKKENLSLLDTDEKKEAFRDYVKTFGAWTRSEIWSWDDVELNALLLQLIAGDVQESPAKMEDVELYERDGEWWYSHANTSDMESGPLESRSNAYHGAANEYYRPHLYPTADSLEEIDWEEYEVMANAGRISGRISGAGGEGVEYYYMIAE